MKKVFALLASLLAGLLSLAQEPQTWWMSADFGYGWTLRERGQHLRVDPAAQKEMGAFNLTFCYQLAPQLSLGAGIGAAVYTNTDLTAMPILLDVRYRVAALGGTFVFANVGLPIKAETSSTGFGSSAPDNYPVSYKHGVFATLGAGYRVPLGDRWAVRAAAGYQLFPYAVDIDFYNSPPRQSWADSRTKQGLLLSFGVEYSLAPYRPSPTSLGEQRAVERREKNRRFWLTEMFLMFFGAR